MRREIVNMAKQSLSAAEEILLVRLCKYATTRFDLAVIPHSRFRKLKI